MKAALGTLFVGVIFGAALSRIGFTDWGEVHRMFTFDSLRLVLAFGTAVVLLTPAWLLIAKGTGARWPERRIHPGTIIGGVLFGVGWAVSGACPSIALVQIGEGQLGAVWTLVGIFFGNWLYSLVHERFFWWPVSGCADN